MAPARALIDPDSRYPSTGLRQVEEAALRVLDLLPGATVERTRDVIQIEFGGEAGLVAVVTCEALELRLPSVEWTMGAYGPATSSRLWRRVSRSRLGRKKLERLLLEARQARADEFSRCRFCGGEFPPERTIEKDVCHACAERHLGVMF
jgi:hypothetical protein